MWSRRRSWLRRAPSSAAARAVEDRDPAGDGGREPVLDREQLLDLLAEGHRRQLGGILAVEEIERAGRHLERRTSPRRGTRSHGTHVPILPQRTRPASP